MSLLISTIVGIAGFVVARWALVAALAAVDWRTQRTSAPDPADIEPLTIVVPAWNEALVIERTVRSALASDLPDVRVLVVDDGSTDGTAALAATLGPQVSVLVQERNQGKAAALNRGLAEATTRLVLTVDADTMLDPSAARWLVATQRQTRATAVAANVRVGNRRHLLTRWQSLEYVAGLNLDRRALHTLGVITTIPGAAALWVREAVLDAGGFSGDTLAEDTDLSVTLLRAGHRLVYQDRADAYTEAPATIDGLWRQRRRWLFGNLACLWKHGSAPGASWRVRFIALPNLWFAHLGIYLIPWVLSALSLGVPPASLAPLATLGSIALALDLTCVGAAYLVDRADPLDLLHLPLQRVAYPWFVMGVFGSVWVRPPRSWAKIPRRNTALLG